MISLIGEKKKLGKGIAHQLVKLDTAAFNFGETKEKFSNKRFFLHVSH